MSLRPSYATSAGSQGFSGPVRSATGAALLAAAATLTACGGGGGGSSEIAVEGGGGAQTPGSGNFSYPAGFEPSPGGFFEDDHFQGLASNPQIVAMSWGRLADVFDFDIVTGQRTLRHRDYVIGEDIISDGVDFLLEINPVTEQTTLTVLHVAGTNAFQSAFDRLDDNLGPVLAKGILPSELPPFSFVPRNGVLMIEFSDLLDHDSVNAETVKVGTGYPPILPYEPRILVDPNHGGLISTANGKEFRSSRILIDTTVSEVEAQDGDSVKVNSVGLPASITTAQPNILVRIPSKVSPASGQFEVLQNHSRHPIIPKDNKLVDFATGSEDIVRAIRSGGEESVTGDSNNGFLLDLNAPRILGSQPIVITSVSPDPVAGPGNFVINALFDSVICSQTPGLGDVIEQPGVFTEVTQPAGPPAAGAISDVRVRLVAGDAENLIPGQGLFNSVYDIGDNERCFVTFSPTPTSFPADGVDPVSQVAVRFSEPMDPASVQVFDTFTVTREPLVASLNDLVVGDVVASSDLREFRFVPLLPFAHSLMTAEDYFLNVMSGDGGVTDLAGNALATVLPQVAFTLDPNAPTERNGSVVLKFDSADEDLNGFPELRGQFLLDLQRESIKPRPVSRFSAVADRTQAVPSLMVPFIPGVQTPLSPLGSKMMTLYRYFDVGFSATDEATHNVDIEGMAWTPISGQVIFDFYKEFEIRLAHSRRLPDEVVNPSSLLPTAPNSGLSVASFDDNVLDDPLNPLTLVHSKEKGYAVNPLDLFTSSTGTTMMPYPLNRTGDVADYTFYTWRDTAIRATGAPSGNGIDPQIMANAGLTTEVGTIAKANFVPSFGLPILMEFRCFPDSGALGLNAFDVSIAINSSSRPVFRIFSTGGFNTAGSPITKNPDLENKPTGGFNPSSNPPGKTTPVRDNVFYIGQLDLVTRISRVHSIFFEADGDTNPDYMTPVVEPVAEQQPLGTKIELAYRGATTVTAGPNGAPGADAGTLDVYGDEADGDGSGLPGDPASKNVDISFLGMDDTYKSSIDEIDGARFFQFRISFLNNADTELSPELSALGFAFLKNGGF